MIKLKQFEFKQLDENIWIYSIYKSEEENGVGLSIVILKSDDNCYEVKISTPLCSQFIDNECQFSTYAEAENAAKEFIKKILMQHIEME